VIQSSDTTLQAGDSQLHELEVGSILDRYLLLEDLHLAHDRSRSMRTFLCLDRTNQAEIVLRVLHLDPEERERFLAECAIARQIESQVLPEILASGLAGNLVFLANAWRPSVSLPQLLAGGGLPLEPACRILWSLTQALQDLHARGLMHADLRPENVHFSSTGELVLLGFLPARVSAVLNRNLDQEKLRRYTSPEWARSRSLLPTGDVYALGLLALEILTGRPVFPLATQAQTLQLQSQLHTALSRDASKVLSNLPKTLHKPIRRMLEFDRNLRPVTVMNLLPSLETALAGTNFSHPLREVIQESLRFPLSETGAQLLVGARELLQAGQPLPAAARLRRFSELLPHPRSVDLQTARELLQTSLWETFQQRERLSSEVHIAICLEVYRTSERLGIPTISVLARLRLGGFLEPGSPLAVLLPQGLTPELIRGKQLQLSRRLRDHPANEEALLGLAIFHQDEAPPPESCLSLLQASICSRWNVPQSGIYHAARALATTSDQKRALEFMEKLLESVRKEEDASSSSSPRDPALIRAEIIMEPARFEDPPSAPVPIPETLPQRLPKDDSAEETEPLSVAPALESGEPPDVVPEILERFENLLEREKLTEAATALSEVLLAPPSLQERHFSGLCSRIREFLWKALLPFPDSLRTDLALEKVLEVARSIEFGDVVPIGERILVSILPEAQREERLEALLKAAPQSIPILQTASRLAANRGDDATWIRHLSAAGTTFLNLGEMKLASQMFMALRALDLESLAATEGLAQTFALGHKSVEANFRWQSAQEAIAQAEFPSEALIPCRGILALYPNFVPAQEAAAKLHESDGNGSAAAKIYLRLAKRSLLREENDRARHFFRKVLANDYGSEEALMYLAVLTPPPFDAPREVWKLKVTLFEREELFEAAIFHARQVLTGEQEDFSVLALLTRLCQASNQDPSPHLLAQGHLAWTQGDLQAARDCFEAAIEQSTDHNALIEELLLTSGIEAVLGRQELLSLRR
jgi:serine/threonine protein kinase